MTNIHSYADAAASHRASPRGASSEPLAPVARTDVEGDAAVEFARVAFVHWRLSVAAPTAWGAERFFDRFVATSRPCREPPEGAALEVARARFAALVQPRLLPPLEQAIYLAGELPDVTDPSTIEESLERIDDLLAVHGGGVPIEAIVETHRVAAYARRLVGSRISRRLDEARWAAGASRTPPVHDTDPLDPVQYAGWTLAHWLADDGLFAPTASNAQQYFGFFTNTAGRFRNPHEGEETDETFERYMELVGAHLADRLGHARHVAARLSGVGTVADVERRLDAIEQLLERDGRRLTLTDIVRLDRLPPLARDVVLRRHAARRAAEAGPAGPSTTAPATRLRADGAAPAPASQRHRHGSAAGADIPVAGGCCGPDPDPDAAADDSKGGSR